MAKNDTKGMMNLIKTCSLLNENTLDNYGFASLAESIENKSVSESSVSQKYINDLFHKIKKNQKEQVPTGIQDDFLALFLKYLNFKTFKEFEAIFTLIRFYYDSSKIDLSKFKENKIAVVHPPNLAKLIANKTQFIQNSFELKIETINKTNKDTTTVISEINKLLVEFPMIVFCIDSDWMNELVKNNEFADFNALIKSDRVIPILINEQKLNDSKILAPFIDSSKSLSGMVQFIMILLEIEASYQLKLLKKQQNTNFGVKTKIENFHNSGAVFLGDNQKIEGENIAFGNIIQNFNKKED